MLWARFLKISSGISRESSLPIPIQSLLFIGRQIPEGGMRAAVVVETLDIIEYISLDWYGKVLVGHDLFLRMKRQEK